MQNLPSDSDIDLHVQLLVRFHELKSTIRQKSPTYDFRSKYWQLCVTEFVRQFIAFIAALKAKCKTKIQLDTMIDIIGIPPPIYLVWHSFALNPKSFYDTFKYNEFALFAQHPFPFAKALRSLSDSSPYINFYNVVTPFLDVGPDYITDFSYSRFASTIDFEKIRYPIFCPNCETPIPTYLTTSKNTGFADQLFEADKEECTKQIMNHQLLRTMKLITDCRKPKVLPGMVKYFNSELTSNSLDLQESDSRIKKFILGNQHELCDIYIKEFLNKYKSCFAEQELLVLRDYVDANLIQYTLKEPRFDIQDDLVGCVIRQGRFIDKIYELRNKLNKVGVKRYTRFFQLMETSTHLLIPTLDIDLVWHTHQLNQPQYFEYSRIVARKIIDHDDKIESGILSDCFEKTSELYIKRFGERYSECTCKVCSSKQIPLLARFGGVSNKELRVISYHNQVIGPTATGRDIQRCELIYDGLEYSSSDFVVNPVQVTNHIYSDEDIKDVRTIPIRESSPPPSPPPTYEYSQQEHSQENHQDENLPSY